MSIGMPYEEYWYGSPYLVGIYKKAFELQKINENQKLWLQGLYNYKAFSAVIENFAYGLNGCKGKRPEPYIDKPLPITDIEKQWDKQERIEKTKQFFMDGQK